MSDPTKKEVPINPPEHKSIELWYLMNFQCSVAAGWSSGPLELDLLDKKDSTHPSELKRMKEATGTTKQ